MTESSLMTCILLPEWLSTVQPSRRQSARRQFGVVLRGLHDQLAGLNLVVLLLLLGAVIFSSVSSAFAQTSMGIAHPTRPGTNVDRFAQRLAEALNEAGGDIGIEAEVFAGSVGGSADIYEQVRLGKLDAGLVLAIRPYFATGMTAPFTFSSFDAAVPYFAEFESDDVEDGVRPLALFPVEVMGFFSREEIAPAELQDTTILTTQPSIFEPFSELAIESRGPEVLPSNAEIERGVVEVPYLYTLSQSPTSGVLSRLDHRLIAYVLLVNEDFYNSLSEEVQEVITEVAADSSLSQLEEFSNQLETAEERGREAGWNIQNMTPVEYGELQIDVLLTTRGGPSCTRDEYRRKYENACRCTRGNEEHECPP